MIQNPLINPDIITHQPSNATQATSSPEIPVSLNYTGMMRPWSTNTFDCMKDEETCWWGTWCCWLLHARTAASFDLGDSLKMSSLFWGLMSIGVIMLIIGLGPVAVLYFIVIGVYLAYDRARIRTAIRNRLGIFGDPSHDFMSHWCMSCCSVCQEGREANVAHVKALDFCSGEELSNIRHEHAAFNGEDLHGGNFMSHVEALSKTSKIILLICATVAFFSIMIQLVQGKFLNIAVLAITFIQPFLILYIVYWRARRKYASLDYVVKLFAVGFWLTTFQSMILELLLQLMIAIVLLPFITGLPPPPTSAPAISSHLRQQIMDPSFMQHAVGMIFNRQLQSQEDDIPSDDAINSQQHLLRHNIVIVVIGLLLMAYVVAAGVEETMKHFVVRCCRFPVALKDPHTVLVYLMAGALGFATFENIEYVFGTKRSPIPGYSLFVGELFVLLVRVLMPVHVICSVLQAVNVSKIIMGMTRLSLFQILLPAILLHGTFDFVIFMIGVLQFIEGGSSITYDVLSLLIPLLIAIAGGVWAYISYKKIEGMYDGGYIVSSTSEHEMVATRTEP